MTAKNIFTYILMVMPWLCTSKYLPGFSFFSVSSLKPDTDSKPDVNSIIPLLKSLKSPKPEERNFQILLNQLGSRYDPMYTSVTEPDALRAKDPRRSENSEVHEHLKNHPLMGEHLKKMKFFGKRANGKKREFGKKTSQKFRHWLWNLSRCPVRYHWIDLGPNVFPRFMKRGQCSKKKTCSYPAGMKCKEKRWKEVTVLLYACFKDLNSISPSCRWRFMEMYALTECQCGCKNHTEST